MRRCPMVMVMVMVIRIVIAWPLGAATVNAAPPVAALPTPAGLACLPSWYAASVAPEGAPGLILADGRRVPWTVSGGAARSLAQRLARPSLADLYEPRYAAGAIVPAVIVDHDPGRVRIDTLFEVTYPRAGLVPLSFFGQRITVHRRVVPALRRVIGRLEAAARLAARPAALRRFLHGLGGAWVARRIAGTERQSAHTWGIALDLNVSLSHYWRWQRPAAPLRWQSRMPQAIVDAFEAEGFIWGGRWYHYDTMHFEYRPELLDPRCVG